MPAKIDADKCTGCSECVETCPMDAIAMNSDIAVVDQDTCTDCGVCEDACPVEAISME